MIDEKKIEETAQRYCKVTDANEKETSLLMEGFKEGAHWAINKFLKGLWHDASEEPKEGENIVYYDGEYIDSLTWIRLFHHGKRALIKETWEEVSTPLNILCWCYLSDLLPKEGGEK